MFWENGGKKQFWNFIRPESVNLDFCGQLMTLKRECLLTLKQSLCMGVCFKQDSFFGSVFLAVFYTKCVWEENSFNHGEGYLYNENRLVLMPDRCFK